MSDLHGLHTRLEALLELQGNADTPEEHDDLELEIVALRRQIDGVPANPFLHGKGVPIDVLDAIDAIVAYNWADEQEDFRDQITDGGEPVHHIFNALSLVNGWLHGATGPDPRDVALDFFINTINVTGGIESQDDGQYAPAVDEEWFDLAHAYLKACKARGVEPVLKNEKED